MDRINLLMGTYRRHANVFNDIWNVYHGAVLRLTGLEKCPRWFFNGISVQ